MVVSALESGSDEFLAHLFQEGQLISWLTSAPEAITPKSRPNDDRAGAVLIFRSRFRLPQPMPSRPSCARAVPGQVRSLGCHYPRYIAEQK